MFLATDCWTAHQAVNWGTTPPNLYWHSYQGPQGGKHSKQLEEDSNSPSKCFLYLRSCMWREQFIHIFKYVISSFTFSFFFFNSWAAPGGGPFSHLLRFALVQAETTWLRLLPECRHWTNVGCWHAQVLLWFAFNKEFSPVVPGKPMLFQENDECCVNNFLQRQSELSMYARTTSPYCISDMFRNWLWPR